MSVAWVDHLLYVCLERREIHRQGKANRARSPRNITTVYFIFVGIKDVLGPTNIQFSPNR